MQRDGGVRGRRISVVVAGTVLLAGTSACSSEQENVGDPQAMPATSAPVKISVSLPDGAKDVDTKKVISVKAEGGTLGEVTVASSDGKRTVNGAIGPDKSWTSTGFLAPTTTYTVKATAKNGSGETTTTSTFSTVAAANSVGYTVTPDGWTVGSGMPIQVKFNAPVTDVEVRKDIESMLTVTAEPSQVGSWGWTNDTTLLYRPKEYWAAGTKLTVNAPLSGIRITSGNYLTEDHGAKLNIGTQRIMKVDLNAHTMVLKENGQEVKTFQISGGRPGERFETRNGTKVIQDKHPDITMDSSTFGVDKSDPEYYRTKVKWAMRITSSGEFLHSAPWSVDKQGSENVSHGCINMAPGDAEWLFKRSQYGDVVENVGSAFDLKPGEAGIPVWLWTWDQWQEKSARKSAKATGGASGAATPMNPDGGA
ncbi:putative L,D-transpeptidase LppS [Austwickia sp. TVS 96-490-7B]|uniref:L,D-transpeptidase n=1 Tax=Austwickia sp. TVS 96-490-7B TaxID=2830843 RepID=UPI001C586364|nr:Ig-like domain-containing protein [Austwickia sp. TVS 96-490-7B]MBW3086089.1 putative L,D-transpeptidase LppS [Austwickia sp. TVS 96-490-7B]